MYSYKMTKEKMEELSDADLLKLYEEFVKRSHYEAVDEFRYLKEMEVDRYDVQKEIFYRMNPDISKRWKSTDMMYKKKSSIG